MSDVASASAANDSSTFVDRIVRTVAVVTLFYAALHVIQYGVYLAVEGSWWNYARGDLRPAERAIQLSRFGLMLLLLVGSIGLLKRKVWARPAVMWWAVLFVVINFASGIVTSLQFARDLAATKATTQMAVQPPIWQMLMWQAFWCVEAALFPLLVWLLLRHREVAKLFEKTARGGFEVLPIARPVEPDT